MCLHPRDASQTVHSPTRAQSVTKRKLDVSASDPHDAAFPGPPSSRPSNPMNASPFPTSASFKSQSHYDQRPYTGLGSSAMHPVMFYPFAYSLCSIHLLPFLRLIVSLCFLHTCHVHGVNVCWFPWFLTDVHVHCSHVRGPVGRASGGWDRSTLPNLNKEFIINKRNASIAKHPWYELFSSRVVAHPRAFLFPPNNLFRHCLLSRSTSPAVLSCHFVHLW